jgi:DNA-binding transcriptional ArsR family regulator
MPIASARLSGEGRLPRRGGGGKVGHGALVDAGASPLDSFRRLANRLIMSKVFKALSDPTRRRVLHLLRKGPMSAGELSDQFEVSKPTMSAHFAVLREADLVHTEKAGKSVIYHLKLSVLEEALLGFVQSFGLGAEAPEPEPELKKEIVR